jgi:hypothetical protein
MGRNEDRREFTTDTRMSLLEGDLDRQDLRLDQFVAELKGLRQVLVGILVSLTTASILLAVNLAVGLG